jgi:hypothetical protein
LARDSICNFAGVFATLLVCAVPFYYECLADMREIEIVVKLGGNPDFSDFYTSVIGWSDIDVIRLPSIIEVKFYIFKECGLIAFNGEMIMRLARYQIFC